MVHWLLRELERIDPRTSFCFDLNPAVLLSLAFIELVPKPLARFLRLHDFFQFSLGVEYSDFLKHGSLLFSAGRTIPLHELRTFWW